MSGTDRHAAPETALMFERFDVTCVAALRHDVARRAEGTGLDGEALEDFVLAVNELITNAVRHGGGSGSLRMWLAGDRLVCEVSDEGAGIVEGSNGRDRPSPHVAGGWGMWLARELSDSMVVTTGPTGTTVQISTRVGAGNGDRGRDRP